MAAATLDAEVDADGPLRSQQRGSRAQTLHQEAVHGSTQLVVATSPALLLVRVMVKNCYILPVDPEAPYRVGIADLTNMGEMVPGTMTITRINIPETHRGQGLGTKLLQMITDAADEEPTMLTLEIMPSGPLNYEQLYDWYVRHGFCQSPFPGVLIRYPKEA